jgi:hypothetical protein
MKANTPQPNTVDLSKCKKGDILIGRNGYTFEYQTAKEYGRFYWWDHVIRLIKDENGNYFPTEKRTYMGYNNDGSYSVKSDYDIVEIIPIEVDYKEFNYTYNELLEAYTVGVKGGVKFEEWVSEFVKSCKRA